VNARATERSWNRLRERLRTARNRAGLSGPTLARRLRVSRSTIHGLEAGHVYSRMDTILAYAHAVGLDVAAVPPHLANLLDLDAADVVAILRAAQTAADGHRLNPLQARRVTDILNRVIPRPQP
jgi:transcriptional regulator with XRE-family HTH domain